MVDLAQIARAAERIRDGGVVAFPTETVYGLGANALDASAVRRIYEIKGRPATSPLIVHVASIAMAKELVTGWPEQAERLAAAFWPGPLTLVLPKKPDVPDEVTAGLDTVGLRMPAHPVALALIEAAGLPIAAPSANRFMALSPTTAAHVREGLGASVDLILDGGPCAVGIESTVLAIRNAVATILRSGMLTRPAIEGVIGQVRTDLSGAESQPHASPGQHDKHYAPRAPLYVVMDASGPPCAGRGIYLLRSAPSTAIPAIQMPAEASAYAAVLYDVLHRCDSGAWDWIAVERPPQTEEWAGVLDRLNRAKTSS